MAHTPEQAHSKLNPLLDAAIISFTRISIREKFVQTYGSNSLEPEFESPIAAKPSPVRVNIISSEVNNFIEAVEDSQNFYACVTLIDLINDLDQQEVIEEKQLPLP